METNKKTIERISRSVTLKAFIIGFLTLVMLIPAVMIQDLIREREIRSEQTVEVINAKWSSAQTIAGPVLVIPYTYTYLDDKNHEIIKKSKITFTPEQLNIKAKLFPEEKHLGIYKSILYKSELQLSGNFAKIDQSKFGSAVILWDEAYFRIGLSDLRGVTSQVDFEMKNKHFPFEAGGNAQDAIGSGLIVAVGKAVLLPTDSSLNFSCKMKLNGSSHINFVPLARNTHAEVTGAWPSPGFIGGFSPESTVTDKGFTAVWNVLHFNRSIPENWVEDQVESFEPSTFGVDLIDTVNHYQQNMRSAKYAIMFIGLTFLVFFFVEVITKIRIHPIQYVLVGFALIIFYSLLLSVSEQLNFAIAYLIAAVATILLIMMYVQGIFKTKKHTAMLGGFLSALYGFLYVILQLEDVALLIGSIGLFVILAVVMYFSRKINWYREAEESEKSEIKELE